MDLHDILDVGDRLTSTVWSISCDSLCSELASGYSNFGLVGMCGIPVAAVVGRSIDNFVVPWHATLVATSIPLDF